jgi:hypothetical protein
MGKVALSIVIPLLLVAAWWLGTQSSQAPAATPVPTKVAAQPSPSVPPSASQAPAASATPVPSEGRPDYSAQADRPAAFPSPSPLPTPETLARKQEYSATDLHWFVPSDAEMAPFGFVFIANRSIDNHTGLFFNLSEFYSSSAKVGQLGDGFQGLFTAACVYANGTRDSIPCAIQIIAYASQALAASQVTYNATPEVTDPGPAGAGDKSVAYRLDRASDPGRGTFYKVLFSRKNVFVSVELPATRGDGSRLDALAIALLVDGKI